MTDAIQTSTRKSLRLWVFFSLLYLITVSLILIGFGLLWNDHNKLSNRVRQLHNELILQQRSISANQSKIQALVAPQEKRTRILSETEYLLQLANLNLTYQGNIPLSTKLLIIADQQLASLADPALTEIRQSLTNDITTLQATPKIDLIGLVLRLNAISQQIPQLPLISQPEQKNNTAQPAAPPSTTPESAWKKGLIALGHAFKNVVIVRHLDQPVQPLISPEQQTFLIQNIQLKLSLAEWAALHQQPELYQQNLQLATQWIQQYFVQNNTLTQSVLQNLAELRKINVKPTLPDITNSLTLIQNELKQS